LDLRLLQLLNCGQGTADQTHACTITEIVVHTLAAGYYEAKDPKTEVFYNTMPNGELDWATA